MLSKILGNKGGYEGQVENFASHEPPENLFARAKVLYLDKLNSAIRERDNWKKAFFCAIFLVFFLVTSISYLAITKRDVIHIVEMDTTTGAYRNVGILQDEQTKPNEAVTLFFIGQFVEKVRTVPLDPVLYEKNWIEAKVMMAGGTGSKMATVMNSDPEMNKALGNKTVLPKIISIVPVTKDTYQCRWSEEHFALNGSGIKDNRIMNGVFTVEIVKPQNDQEYNINPLGIRIRDFSWAVEKK